MHTGTVKFSSHACRVVLGNRASSFWKNWFLVFLGFGFFCHNTVFCLRVGWFGGAKSVTFSCSMSCRQGTCEVSFPSWVSTKVLNVTWLTKTYLTSVKLSWQPQHFFGKDRCTDTRCTDTQAQTPACYTQCVFITCTVVVLLLHCY